MWELTQTLISVATHVDDIVMCCMRVGNGHSASFSPYLRMLSAFCHVELQSFPCSPKYLEINFCVTVNNTCIPKLKAKKLKNSRSSGDLQSYKKAHLK